MSEVEVGLLIRAAPSKRDRVLLEVIYAGGLPVGPTIGSNGAWHPEPGYANKFTGRYEHRNIVGGIGHNLPQEDPKTFVQAIIDVDAA